MTTVTQEVVYNEKKRFYKTNKWKKTSFNTYLYENQISTKIDEKNWSIELLHEQYHQNELPSSKNYKLKYHTGNHQRRFYKNKSTFNENPHENHLKSIQRSKTYDLSKNKDYLQNTKTCNSDSHTGTQQKKTPITLLNEWAMQHNKYGKNEGEKNKNVSYELIAVTGQAHRPIFTYMCKVLNKTAKGDGFSKKEAKQNSAAQLWEQLFEINSNSVQHPTSTTNGDNFEVNKNDAENVTSAKKTHIIDNTDADSSVRALPFNNDTVKVAQCDINPVGALQELSTTHKWMPPFYNFEKLGKGRRAVFEVKCKFFHLLTSGIANTKKDAKRKAARCMLDLISDIGTDILNELKQETKIIVPKENCHKKECNEDCVMVKEKNQKLPQELISANCFRSYFTYAISVAVNSLPEFSSYSLSDTNSVQYLQQKIKCNQLTKEMEQYIINNNSDLNAVHKLQTLCQQLNFQAIFVLVNDHKKTKLNTNQDEKYTILIQVNTIPNFVSIGQASSIDEATEIAAQNILNSFKTMLQI